jgi:hypothetical protein
MRTMKILAGGLAVLALSTGAFAQSGAASAPSTSARPAVTKPAPAASARGTLTAVDTAANSITLKSGKHEWTFALASNAVIHEGTKNITIADLASHKGHEAKVRYSETGGTKTAQSVMVAAAKTASKPATN